MRISIEEMLKHSDKASNSPNSKKREVLLVFKIIKPITFSVYILRGKHYVSSVLTNNPRKLTFLRSASSSTVLFFIPQVIMVAALSLRVSSFD